MTIKELINKQARARRTAVDQFRYDTGMSKGIPVDFSITFDFAVRDPAYINRIVWSDGMIRQLMNKPNPMLQYLGGAVR